jgi:hypothetical protein
VSDTRSNAVTLDSAHIVHSPFRHNAEQFHDTTTPSLLVLDAFGEATLAPMSITRSAEHCELPGDRNDRYASKGRDTIFNDCKIAWAVPSEGDVTHADNPMPLAALNDAEMPLLDADSSQIVGSCTLNVSYTSNISRGDGVTPSNACAS